MEHTRTQQAKTRRAPTRTKTALIFSHPNDIHARAVAAEVIATFGGRAEIIDTTFYPNDLRLTFTQDNDVNSGWMLDFAGRRWKSEEIVGVWRRRPSPHRISTDVRDRRARRFSADEAAAAFQGWLHTLGERVINPLAADYAAMRKPFQLHVARQLGLLVPDTVITNDPQEARTFIDRHEGRVVFKVLTGTSWQFTETRRFRKGYKRHLTGLRYAPAIFQELVEADLDIRVTVVDDEVFPVSIKPFNPRARLDWRLDLSAEIKPHRLPRETKRTLLKYVHALGLRYGALDLRLTAKGDYVFLEINPAGQFLFCEIHGNQPISKAIAAALLRV